MALTKQPRWGQALLCRSKGSGSPAQTQQVGLVMQWRRRGAANMRSTGTVCPVARSDRKTMTNPPVSDEPTLSAKERALIRTEFMVRFSSAPRLADGILVKRWATGPNKGQPKPSATIQDMIDRGLMELPDDGKHWLRARFTVAGLNALRRMAADPRALPCKDYQHLHEELGMGGDEASEDGPLSGAG